MTKGRAAVAHPHDVLARHFLSSEDVAADLLRRYLDPEVAELLDLDRLRCESTGAVDETLSEYIGDLRYSTTFRHSDRRSEVFIFLEHQSKKDRMIGFRLLRYIINEYGKLLDGQGGSGRIEAFPYPVAVVLYHGKSRWKDFPRMPDLIQKAPGADPDVLKFPLFLIDLAALPDNAIQGLPALRALLEALRAASAGNLGRRIDSITGELAQAKGDRRAGGWMSALLRYAAEHIKFKNAKEFYVRAFGRLFNRKEAENMAMTTAKEFELEGGAKMIVTVLSTRFGRVPASVKKAIEACSDFDALDSLAALAATCKNIEEFKRGLKR